MVYTRGNLVCTLESLYYLHGCGRLLSLVLPQVASRRAATAAAALKMRTALDGVAGKVSWKCCSLRKCVLRARPPFAPSKADATSAGADLAADRPASQLHLTASTSLQTKQIAPSHVVRQRRYRWDYP